MIRLLLVSFLSVMFSMGSTQGQDLDGEALAMGYGQSPSEYPPVPDDLVTVDLASGIVGPSIRHLWRSVYLRSLPSEEVARCDASRARPRDFGPLSAELLASLRDGDPAIRDRALRSVKSISGMSESIENEVARTARFNAGELAAAGNDRVKAARARIQIAGSEDGVAAAVRILSESGLGFLGDEPPPVSSRELSTQSRFEPGTLIAQIEEGLSRGGRLRFVPDRDEIRRALGVLERFVDSNGYARLDGESQEPATGIGDVASTMYQGNRGITQMMADTAARDPVFSARCLRFYRELSRIDHRSGAVSDKGTQVDVWATPDGPDVWALAMAEQGENPLEAIRCVGLLGHDNAARLSSGGGNRWVSLFNGFNPADSSRLFEPGSLSGLNVSSQTAGRWRGLRDRVTQAQSVYLKEVALAPRDPEAFHDPVETLRGELTAGDNGSAFRAGYYHFIGGALMAAELMAADVGRVGPGPMDWINMPEFLAGITAEYYKLKTMPTHINSSPELRQLFNNGEGYPKNRRFRPDGWSDAKLEYYRARMDLLFEHVDLAVEQHKRGAEFIMNQLREWVNSPEYDRQCGSAMALTVSDRGDGSARSVAPAVSVPGQELPSVWSGSMEATPEVSVGSSQPSASPSNGRSGW